MAENYLVDYHVHTDNSFDSKEKMIEHCKRAVDIGLQEIVFTEHFDLNPGDTGLGHFSYEKYSREIKECREILGEKLKIKKGLELGEPHLYQERHRDFLQKKEFDFFLGSVHYIGSKVLHSEYEDVVEREVYLSYFEEVLETARKGIYHVLGHLDVLKRYVPASFTKFKAVDYEEIIREILKELIKNSKGIELNTSGLRQKGLEETLPTIEILKWYRDLGGEIITIGSDAHRKEDLGSGIKEGIQFLKAVGFSRISIFTNGEIDMIKI